jgi:AcrR family transcriptional regulator
MADQNDSSSRDLLLAAARKVFAERGLEGATVKDLAEEAGVNVSLVSYYFGGKEGLYRACLEQFSRARLETAERVLKNPQSTEDFRVRLQMFCEELMRANIRDYDVCRVLHRDFDMGMNAVAHDVFKTSFLPVFNAFATFFKNAQKAKFLRADMDPELSASMVFGSILHFVKNDNLRKELRGESLVDEKVLEKTAREIVKLTMDGLQRRTES